MSLMLLSCQPFVLFGLLSRVIMGDWVGMDVVRAGALLFLVPLVVEKQCAVFSCL